MKKTSQNDTWLCVVTPLALYHQYRSQFMTSKINNVASCYLWLTGLLQINSWSQQAQMAVVFSCLQFGPKTLLLRRGWTVLRS